MRFRVLFFRLLFPVIFLVVCAMILHRQDQPWQPPPPMRWDALSAHALTADMIDADGKRMPAQALIDAKRLVLYFSSSSSADGAGFTPKLIEFYRKHGGGTAFQLLFISRDKDEDLPAAMRADGMPWWGVRSFAARQISNAYPGTTIPRLVLLDEDGRAAADSSQGGMEPVLARIAAAGN